MKTVTVYSKDYCPYCVEAKRLLDILDIPYREVDVTHDYDTLAEISRKSGMRTVPQIWADDDCLGGYTDLVRLHENRELDERIARQL
jgi:glutaredoxin 3